LGEAQTNAPSKGPATNDSYIRISKSDSNSVQLQIAARKFVPASGKGPAIWLTGVSHIGDTNYYAELQKHLDARTVVLYEGVGGPHGKPKPKPATGEAAAAAGGMSSLQSFMASSLGLAFQLEAIDYSGDNFRNSDLTVEELRKLMEEQSELRGRNGGQQEFESLLQMMEGRSMWSALLQAGMSFLGGSAKLRGMSKLTIIEALGSMDGDLAQMGGLPASMKDLMEVLIQKRNQKVMKDLATEVKRAKAGDSISVFYGTGHMPDMEKRLASELHYQPADQEWFTAVSVNLRRSGISPGEAAYLHDMIKGQMKQLQSRPRSSNPTNSPSWKN
jgi:hypothetical protein